MADRYHVDWRAWDENAQTAPCFVCKIAAHHPDYPAHMIYEDENALVFLDKYPIQYGHTLVAPRIHREQVTGDFTEAEYLALQRVVYHVAEAIRAEVQPERIYIFTLGSQQGNSHVHWHIVPLPPGIPYAKQQFAALRRSEIGILQVSEEEQHTLATRLRQRLTASGLSG